MAPRDYIRVDKEHLFVVDHVTKVISVPSTWEKEDLPEDVSCMAHGGVDNYVKQYYIT